MAAGAVLICATALHAQVTVTSPAGLTREICDACPMPVRLPIDIQGPVGAKFAARVTDVAFGGHSRQDLAGLVTPEIREEKGGRELVLLFSELRAAGTYTVRVEVRDLSSGQAAPAIVLQLVRPTATLQAPQTLIVERLVGDPFASHVRPALAVLETSGRTAIADLTVTPAPRSTAARANIQINRRAAPCDGAQAAASPHAIPASQKRCVPYDLTGDFPLGTYTQAFSITAPELAATLPLSIEVRSRFPAWYVVLIVFLGAFASWLLKIFLVRAMQVDEAKVAAVNSISVITSDLSGCADDTLRGAVARTMAALTRDIAGGTAEEIKKSADALALEWTAARTAFQERRTLAAQRADVVREIADTEWRYLPAGAADALAIVKEGSAELQELIKGCAADRALAQEKSLAARAVGAFARQIDVAKRVTPGFLARIQNATSPETKEVMAPSISAASTALQAVALPVNGDSAALRQAVSALDGSGRELHIVAGIMRSAIAQEIDRVSQLLGISPDGSRALRENAEEASALFEQETDDARNGNATVDALAALHQTWRDILTQASSGGQLPAAAEEALRQRRYVAAAAAIDAARPQQLQNDAAGGQEPFIGTMVAPPLSPEASAALSYRTDVAARQQPRLLEFERAESKARIARAKALQTAMVFVFAALVGYGLFAPKFIGDYQDWLVIFFWAFALDLTVEGVTKLAPKART